jgi:3-oxoacyl-[acyl-carrier-protein] synthase II
MKTVVVAADMVTPYGRGIEACWQGIRSGRTAIADVDRFRTEAFHSSCAGIVPGLSYHGDLSLVMQMLAPLLSEARSLVPGDADLMLATTKGEIDLLEMHVLEGRGRDADCSLDRLLARVVGATGLRGESVVISAACASSSAAIARAAARICSGKADAVLVVACDGVTEFIFSGFSSLMALDKGPARPFDRSRSGLTVGESAGYALLMSEERALREGRPLIGTIAGWGLSDDANHMTGPSRESEGLILAITKALKSAGAEPGSVGFISAHGTGTVFNDAMEMRAFQRVFSRPVPVYSLKGGIGHTMGAAGLIEVVLALHALRERTVPATVNLREADRDADGWVFPAERPLQGEALALTTNAGFSGINAALVLGGMK